MLNCIAKGGGIAFQDNIQTDIVFFHGTNIGKKQKYLTGRPDMASEAGAIFPVKKKFSHTVFPLLLYLCRRHEYYNEIYITAKLDMQNSFIFFN
jgi:hypothetical protein